MKIQNNSFHSQLQNKILFICNSVIMITLSVLAVVTFLSDQHKTMVIAIAGVVILGISILLQVLKYFTVASYVSILSLTAATFGVLFNRPEISADLVYLFISYEMVPVVLAGILGQKRSFSISITSLMFVLLTYYIVSVQAPLIGLTHVVQISGSYICLLVIGVLSDQTYLLTGQIMNQYYLEQQTSEDKSKLLSEMINIYQKNQQSGTQLETLHIDNDTLAGQVNKLFQKFTEDMHELNQFLKDINIRGENIKNSSSNILKVFSNHKDNIINYKGKIDQISETSQDIDLIVQNRKVQMNELIELSTKGGTYMQDSITSVEKVAENSKNMVDMISLIMEVAEKTNILALNAAVEASRAGKYGGGFAIVAKEIKSLSTETTQNADTINRSLQNNITSISEAVSIIKNVGELFQHLNSSILDFSGAIDQIVVKINNLNQQNSQMSIETKNTISLVNEVQNVVEKMIQNMESGNQKIAGIQNLSTVLSKDITQLHQTTNSISISGRKMQEKYREYCYSVKKVETVVQDISQQIDSNVK
ncbi:MAG: methyl-accepting chemotaxis protein [Brevinema sp.]